MAASDFIISAKVKLREGDVGNARPNSEAVNSKLGGSINALIDSNFFDETFVYSGYFNANNFDDGYAGITRIHTDSDIIQYFMGIYYTGSSGTNELNVKIYDDTGAFVGDLFGSGASGMRISGSNKNRVLIGRDVENASVFNSNIAGSTIQYGDLNYTTLLAGWVLVPIVVSNGVDALNATFKLRLRGQ